MSLAKVYSMNCPLNDNTPELLIFFRGQQTFGVLFIGWRISNNDLDMEFMLVFRRKKRDAQKPLPY